MGRLTCWSCLVILAVSLNQLEIADACSCALLHPQTHFCEADFVAAVRVQKHANVSKHESAYKVRIQRTFKAAPIAEKALRRKSMWLRTPSMENMCGRDLTLTKTYVISGKIIDGQPRISLCNYAMLLSEVSHRQRKGFQRLYKRGCDCPISYTNFSKKGIRYESTVGKLCLWESPPGPLDCQEQYGICMRGSAGCSWAPSKVYNYCIKQHLRDRGQPRG